MDVSHVATPLERTMSLLKAGHNVIISGPPGSGKSSLIKDVVRCFKGRTSVTASTGIAAYNLRQLGIDAQTVHRYAGILDGRFCVSYLRRLAATDDGFEDARARIRVTDLLIIDECSMLSATIFDQIEMVCRQSLSTAEYFGGLQLLMVLDPLQLPPVGDRFKNDEGLYCFESEIWKQVMTHHVRLDQIFRAQDETLKTLISEITSGQITDYTIKAASALSRELPFPLRKIAIHLFDTNAGVDCHNNTEVELFQNETNSLRCSVYKSIDELGSRDVLDKFVLPAILKLKAGCPVMVLQNNHSQGVFNGMRGTVHQCKSDSVVVQVANSMIELHRTTHTKFSADGTILAKRTQIPLKLAFALTECDCESEGATTCDPRSGHCQCLPGVTGEKYDSCRPL